MAVIISGSSGITSVNGSAAAPSVTGTDTDTGIVYGTNTLSLATGGTTALTANSAQGIQVLNTIGVGNATPSTSGAGITFPATQSASSDANTLDDYEEGTWTPILNSAAGSITYTSSGTYVKIGRQVTLNYSTLITGGTITAISSISNFPFACGSNPGSGVSREYNAVGTAWVVTVGTGGTAAAIIQYNNSQNASNGYGWNGTITYEV